MVEWNRIWSDVVFNFVAAGRCGWAEGQSAGRTNCRQACMCVIRAVLLAGAARIPGHGRQLAAHVTRAPRS
jgi:hypothetical protein